MARHRWWIAAALSIALVGQSALVWATETGPLRKEIDPSEPAGARDPAFDLLWSIIDGGGGISSADGFTLMGAVTGPTPVVMGLFSLDAGAPPRDQLVAEAAGSLEGPVTEFALAPITPTPNRGIANISWALPRQSDVRLTVYDVQGREVAVLADGRYEPGRYSMTWRATDDRRAGGAGVYFIRLHAADRVMTRRTVVTP